MVTGYKEEWHPGGHGACSGRSAGGGEGAAAGVNRQSVQSIGGTRPVMCVDARVSVAWVERARGS